MQRQRKITFEPLRPFFDSTLDVRDLVLLTIADLRNNRVWLLSALAFEDDESLRSILMTLKELFISIGEPAASALCQHLLIDMSESTTPFDQENYAELLFFVDDTIIELATEATS